MEPSIWKRAQDVVLPVPVERWLTDWAVRSLTGTLDLFGFVDEAVPGPTHEIRFVEDIRYGNGDEQLLDYIEPADAAPRGVVVFVHGGGFRTMSKSTHRPLASILAKAGYAVVNIDYRLAPEHPYPAAVEDATDALIWMAGQMESWHLPDDRVVFAGESSGANIALSVALATCFEIDEPWARRAWDSGIVAWGIAPICGFLQVSGPERLDPEGTMPSVVRDRFYESARDYLPESFQDPAVAPMGADPLRFLEQTSPPSRSMPWIMAAAGSRDPVLNDTLRLADATERLGGRSYVRVYEGEPHSFHTYLWRDAAREFWHDWLELMEELDREDRGD